MRFILRNEACSCIIEQKWMLNFFKDLNLLLKNLPRIFVNCTVTLECCQKSWNPFGSSLRTCEINVNNNDDQLYFMSVEHVYNILANSNPSLVLARVCECSLFLSFVELVFVILLTIPKVGNQDGSPCMIFTFLYTTLTPCSVISKYLLWITNVH